MIVNTSVLEGMHVPTFSFWTRLALMVKVSNHHHPLLWQLRLIPTKKQLNHVDVIWDLCLRSMTPSFPNLVHMSLIMRPWSKIINTTPHASTTQIKWARPRFLQVEMDELASHHLAGTWNADSDDGGYGDTIDDDAGDSFHESYWSYESSLVTMTSRIWWLWLW